MKVEAKDNNVYILEADDFVVSQTLECGQCFHFKKLAENDYALVHLNKLLHIKEEDGVITLFDTSLEEYEDIWKKYFDFENDYGKIKERLLNMDDKLKTAMDEMYGVRILNQDFFETLISFIISQNKQIPHIKQIVAVLSEKYGRYLGEIQGEHFYAFPTPKELEKVSLDELYACKTGFRAPYIYDAVHKVCDGEISGTELMAMDDVQCHDSLVSIKGVGDKVANCVMLFSLGKRSSFPVDVWIKRIVENMYFEREAKKEEISAFAKEHFGEYGGYAQQYLFYYGRENKLGKITKQ